MKIAVVLLFSLVLASSACDEDRDWPSYRIPVAGSAAKDSEGSGGTPGDGGESRVWAGRGSSGGASSGGGPSGGAPNGGAPSGGVPGGIAGAPSGAAGDGGSLGGSSPGGGSAVSDAGSGASAGGTLGAGGACGELAGECGGCIAQRCCAEVELCESVAPCGAALENYYACLYLSAVSDGAGGVLLADCGDQFEVAADSGSGSEPEAHGLVSCVQKECKATTACD